MKSLKIKPPKLKPIKPKGMMALGNIGSDIETPAPVKGVYKMNPTNMIMKQGSKASRAAQSQPKKGKQK